MRYWLWVCLSSVLLALSTAMAEPKLSLSSSVDATASASSARLPALGSPALKTPPVSDVVTEGEAAAPQELKKVEIDDQAPQAITHSVSVKQNNSQANFTQVNVQTVKADTLALGVDIDLTLSDELQVALNKGMPLFFTLDVKLYQPRQFWFDRLVYDGSLTIGIRYNILLREWRVYQNNQEFKEFSLEDALKRITRLEGWMLVLKEAVKDGQTYTGKIRLRLDSSLLARPFQITALNNSSAWSFSSSWKDFEFLVQKPKF